MKQLYISIFIIILGFQICCGQKVFKINEGELQFIHPEEGIFIKKENSYYALRYKSIDDLEELSKGFNYELSDRASEEIEKLKKDALTIFATDIVPFNFKELDHQKFTSTLTDGVNYCLYKYNKNFFSIASIENEQKKPVSEYLLNYCILDFGKNKKFICVPNGFIIPTKNKVEISCDDSSVNEAFKKGYKITEFKTLEAREIHSTKSNDLALNNDFYKIDTLKNKQLRIKDIYNEVAITKSFDSISFSGSFIVGYKNNKIDIYNYTFQKLELKNVKAFNFDKFSPSMEVIENNKLKTINLIGENYKNSDRAFYPSYSHFFPSITFKFKVVKKEDYFYIETNDMSSITHVYDYKNSFKLKNSNEFETVEYLNEDLSAITLDSEMLGYTIKNPAIIYAKLKNGKFSLYTIRYLVTENPEKGIADYNDTLPKNLDSISPVSEQTYIIEKNGLFTYYPIVKEIKYKKLEKFQGNYARFELPNGQKGWLSLKGKEYLDQ